MALNYLLWVAGLWIFLLKFVWGCGIIKETTERLIGTYVFNEGLSMKKKIDLIWSISLMVIGIANGRASFIYSKYNQKPNFVNLSEITNKNCIYVEKITDKWFYACK